MKTKPIFIALMLIALVGTAQAQPILDMNKIMKPLSVSEPTILHYWSFNNNVLDTGGLNNGQLVGNATTNFVAGKTGYGLYTNRLQTTFVDLGTDDISGLTDFSIDLYIKPDENQEKCYDPISNNGNYGILGSANDYWSATDWSWQLRYGAPNGCMLGWQVNLATGLQWVQMPHNLSTTDITHLTLIFRQGTSLELYEGKTLVDIKTFPATTIHTNPANRLMAGCEGWCSYGTLYSGMQDEVRVTDHALSQTEIDINDSPVVITSPTGFTAFFAALWAFLRTLFPFLQA